MKKLYLAGPINGCSDDEAKTWREVTKEKLSGDYDFLDPMRRDYRGIEATNFEAITEGDMEDIRASDVILAMCPKPSVGTSMEVFYAKFCLGKKVVVVSDTILSPWLRRFSDLQYSNLMAAITYLRVIKGA